MKYTHLTENERYMLSALRKQGLTVAAIAKALGRHRSTVYREVERNSRWSSYDQLYTYQPARAQQKVRTRTKKARRNKRYDAIDFLLVDALLKLNWSPEQIVGYFRYKGYPVMSHETIYQHVWADKSEGGSLWQYLRQSPKIRRKRYRSKDSRGRVAAKRHISERPELVNERKEFGHWEIDTVIGHGSKHCLVTMVERQSRYTLVGQLDDRTTESLNKRVGWLIKETGLPFKTITADNGTEFNQYQQLEHSHGCDLYFATPYHSWERGTNENTNGLLRQYIPKKQSMALLSQRSCSDIARRLNTRPRKVLGFKTPEEFIREYR